MSEWIKNFPGVAVCLRLENKTLTLLGQTIRSISIPSHEARTYGVNISCFLTILANSSC